MVWARTLWLYGGRLLGPPEIRRQPKPQSGFSTRARSTSLAKGSHLIWSWTDRVAAASSHAGPPALAVTALVEHRARQAQARLRAESWIDDAVVFATAAGTRMDAANVRRDFRRALKPVSGLDPREWTPRELRHSFVSLLSVGPRDRGHLSPGRAQRDTSPSWYTATSCGR